MRNARFGFVLLLFAAVAAFAGDDRPHGDNSESQNHGDNKVTPSVAVTQWTDHMELFMEYPVLVANQPGRFIIHLTTLDGFQPVRVGAVKLSFTGLEDTTHEIEAKGLLREGIFAPYVELPKPGAYEFQLSYAGPEIHSTFHIGDFVVYPAADVIPAVAADEPGGEIGFLKEQQWKIPFATAEAEVREIKRSTWAIGEVLPSPRAYAEIVAPVAGILQIATGDNLALPGSSVRRGDVVATLVSPLQGDGWVSSRLSYEQAKRNYERAERLKELDAISEREFEETRNEFEARKAGFERIEGAGSEALALKAPLSGKIIEWSARPGQLVRAGDKLMAVADPSVVWLRVNVYESDFRSLGLPVGAFINSDAAEGGLILTTADMRVLTTGAALDPETRTIPVLLEVTNTSGRLIIYESTPVELYSSDGDTAIAVPETAVYEDGGFNVVFVQTGGESFEKRMVQKGPRHAGWVSILNGLRPGDRVVTRGGYHVKLASSSAEIGHGHAH
jgi:cobalt-zinc-cadmium efflux system membrane fusion protein